MRPCLLAHCVASLHFARTLPRLHGPARSAELTALLGEMCAELEVVRRGGSAARSSAIDLRDGVTAFLLL